jgi:DNA-binding GntR family transcriptional regulator
VTDTQIAFLRQIGDEMRSAVDQQELLRYSELNVALHSAVREIADHSAANRVLEQLNGQMVRHQFRLFLVPGRPSRSLPEHLAIIEGVCGRDPRKHEKPWSSMSPASSRHSPSSRRPRCANYTTLRLCFC